MASVTRTISLLAMSGSKRGKEGLETSEGKVRSHTLSIAENIPWDCETLIIGIGESGALPVLDEVKTEAGKRGVNLVIMKTEGACRKL